MMVSSRGLLGEEEMRMILRLLVEVARFLQVAVGSWWVTVDDANVGREVAVAVAVAVVVVQNVAVGAVAV